jgi:hypothetical protein
MRKWLRDPVPETPEIPEIRRSDPVPGIFGIPGITGMGSSEDNLASETFPPLPEIPGIPETTQSTQTSGTGPDTERISGISGIFDRVAPEDCKPSTPSTAPSRSTSRPILVAPPGPGQTETAPWAAEDWGCYYNERAAIAEYDGRLPRGQAEARAYACCLSHWLYLNPTSSPPGRCLECGNTARANDPLLAFGVTNTHPNSLTWLHRDCTPAWHSARIAAAVAALASMGIRQPQGDSP